MVLAMTGRVLLECVSSLSHETEVLPFDGSDLFEGVSDLAEVIAAGRDPAMNLRG